MIKARIKKVLRFITFSLMVFVAIITLTFKLGLYYEKFVLVSGFSMMPTIKNHSIAVLKPALNLKDKDIIIFKYKNDILIKRILYCGDKDKVWYSAFLDNNDVKTLIYTIFDSKSLSALNSEYKRQHTKQPDYKKLGSKEYWVAGDNRAYSMSSDNGLGPIDYSKIIAKLDFTISPNGITKF